MDYNKFSEAINKKIESLQYGQQPMELYEPIRYIMALGGKRLRPILTLIGSSIFTENWQKAIDPAMAIEVFHNFTLMHDDIMDNAPTRRGKPTIHKKWNDNVAILSGDVMLVKAFELLYNVENGLLKTVLEGFSKTATEVCEGQQLDMNFENYSDVTIDEYINMIKLKTAVLLGFSLKLGAIMGGATAETAEKMYSIGLNAGLGFQLIDDILDVYGDPSKFGKQVGGDIVANKKTYLLLLAKQQAEGNLKQSLNNWDSKTEFENDEKVKAVVNIYNQLNIRHQAEEKANFYFRNCIAEIEELDVPTDKKRGLIDFILALTNREN